MISKEAENLLFEIIEHESDDNYWAERFESASHRENTILRGSFKELKDKQLVDTKWADNIPYIITVLKDGYLYQQHIEEQEKAERELTMSDFEKNLTELLERAKSLAVLNKMKIDRHGNNPNLLTNVWMDDVQIFYST